MRREDFKEITEGHIEICKKLIEESGNCAEANIDCGECPFASYNSTIQNQKCFEIYVNEHSRDIDDEKLVESAKEFLKLFEGDFAEDNDEINSPKHYKLEGLDIESIDVIFAVVRGIKNGVIADCVGNILKYVMRAEKKNGLKDYKKARRYLDWCIKEKEKGEQQ